MFFFLSFKAAPSYDCSYSKLISKIRENQAKSLATTEASNLQAASIAANFQSASNSPTIVIPEASNSQDKAIVKPVVSNVPGSLIAVAKDDELPMNPSPPPQIPNSSRSVVNDSYLSLETLQQAPPPPPPPIEDDQNSVSNGETKEDGPTLTPRVSSAKSTSRLGVVSSTPRPMVGLVDYPSFNDSTGRYENHSGSDDYNTSDDDQNTYYKKDSKIKSGRITLKNQKIGNKKSKKMNGTKLNGKERRKKISVSDETLNYDDVDWPSPNEQIVIDKIACYVVKKGESFEKAISARGDSRYDFVDEHGKFHEYYQIKVSLFREIFGSVSSSEPKQVKASASNAIGISFSFKQRKTEGSVTLPPTSFPLESSSSDEDVENMEEAERRKWLEEKIERQKWRHMRREQAEK